MKKVTMEKQEERARNAYVPPRIEVYACEPPRVMAVSGGGAGTADPDPGGDITDDATGGNPGGGGAIFGGGGAKRINEREISFSDVWEE